MASIEIGCRTTCQTDCATGCSGCSGNCGANCADACGTSCGTTCGNACGEACSATCIGGCGTTCDGACGDACTATCSDACTTTCGTTCSGGCVTTCAQTCGTSCGADCSGKCSIGCGGTCSGGSSKIVEEDYLNSIDINNKNYKFYDDRIALLDNIKNGQILIYDERTQKLEPGDYSTKDVEKILSDESIVVDETNVKQPKIKVKIADYTNNALQLVTWEEETGLFVPKVEVSNHKISI